MLKLKSYFISSCSIECGKDLEDVNMCFEPWAWRAAGVRFSPDAREAGLSSSFKGTRPSPWVANRNLGHIDCCCCCCCCCCWWWWWWWWWWWYFQFGFFHSNALINLLDGVFDVLASGVGKVHEAIETSDSWMSAVCCQECSLSSSHISGLEIDIQIPQALSALCCHNMGWGNVPTW